MFIAEFSRAKRAQRNTMTKKMWKTTYPRKFGDHVTVRPPDSPYPRQAYQCKISQTTGMVSIRFFLFSLKTSTLPSKFNNLFLINSQIHNYNTRNAHSFPLPQCRANTRQLSIYFQGPKFYNSLNSTITGSSSSASFKRKLKEFLLSTY